MELHTELSKDRVLELLRKGRLGDIDLKPLEMTRLGAGVCDWDYGFFAVRENEAEMVEELGVQHGLPSTLRTRIKITTQLYYEGQLAVYHLTAHVLRNWPGDLALLNYGETVMAQRVSGQIKMRVKQFNDNILPIFAGFDYEPLPVSARDAAQGLNRSKLE